MKTNRLMLCVLLSGMSLMKKDVFCLLGKALRRSDAATLRHNGVLTFVSIVVFAVSAAIVTFAPNAWGDTILHNFAGTPDGAYAYGTLVNDKYGNLYGTTVNGGTTATALYSCYALPGQLLQIFIHARPASASGRNSCSTTSRVPVLEMGPFPMEPWSSMGCMLAGNSPSTARPPTAVVRRSAG